MWSLNQKYSDTTVAVLNIFFTYAFYTDADDVKKLKGSLTRPLPLQQSRLENDVPGLLAVVSTWCQIHCLCFFALSLSTGPSESLEQSCEKWAVVILFFEMIWCCMTSVSGVGSDSRGMCGFCFNSELHFSVDLRLQSCSIGRSWKDKLWQEDSLCTCGYPGIHCKKKRRRKLQRCEVWITCSSHCEGTVTLDNFTGLVSWWFHFSPDQRNYFSSDWLLENWDISPLVFSIVSMG